MLSISKLRNKIINFNSSSVRGLLQKGRYTIAEKKHGNQEKKTKNQRNFLTSYSHWIVHKFFYTFMLPK
jgi:hypothetical protein